jgi:ferredoxin
MAAMKALSAESFIESGVPAAEAGMITRRYRLYEAGIFKRAIAFPRLRRNDSESRSAPGPGAATTRVRRKETRLHDSSTVPIRRTGIDPGAGVGVEGPHMALVIGVDCLCCDVCLDVCPNAAIVADDPIYVIDADRCTECVGHHDESQCVRVCRVDCIGVDPERVELRWQLAQKYETLRQTAVSAGW